MNKKNKNILYLRVSTEKQVEFGKSLEAQKASILNKYENLTKEGYELLIDDGYSGGDKIKRKNYLKIEQMLEQGEQIKLYSYNQDRLHRNLSNLEYLLTLLFKTNSELFLVEGEDNLAKASNKLIVRIMGCLNEYAREDISIKTKNVMRNERKKGIWNNGIPPLGISKDPKTKKLYYNDDAKIVKEIFEMYYTQQIPQTQISKILGEKYKHIKFSKGKVGSILKNTLYFGYKIYDYEGKKEKITFIDKPLLDEKKYNKKIKVKKIMASVAKKHDYLFHDKILINGKIAKVETHVKPSGTVFKYYKIPKKNNKYLRINQSVIMDEISNVLKKENKNKDYKKLQLLVGNMSLKKAQELITKMLNENEKIPFDEIKQINLDYNSRRKCNWKMEFNYNEKKYTTYF